MLGQHMQMPLGGKARGLTGFGVQIQHQRAPGWARTYSRTAGD